jgi:hypothetical protein
MVTYRFPVCPMCRCRLRGGWPRFGPAVVKCGYCGATVQTGLKEWASYPTVRRVFLAIGELGAPSAMGSELFVGLLVGLTCWSTVVGAVPLILRLSRMIKESNGYSRTSEPPTWKFWLKQEFA